MGWYVARVLQPAQSRVTMPHDGSVSDAAQMSNEEFNCIAASCAVELARVTKKGVRVADARGCLGHESVAL